MARNRNRQGGGGGGGGGNQITVKVGLSGKRDNCKVSVLIRTGKFAVPDAEVSLRFGTADNPYGPWLCDPATPANRYVLRTNNEGEGESSAFNLDAEHLKSYTQMLVVYNRVNDPGRGIYEQAVSLPVYEAPSATAKPKYKRLLFKAPEGTLKSRDNQYALPTFRTCNKDGKLSEETLLFRADGKFTLIDVATGKLLSFNGKTARNVQFFFFKSLSAGLVTLECQISGHGITLTVMHIESGEEASLKLEFEY